MAVSTNGLSFILLESILQGSPEIIETVILNESQHNYSIGEFYHLEIKVDDFWYIITYSDKVFYENPKFEDFGSTLIAGYEMTQTFSFKAFDITLIPGEYRLVKTFLGQSEVFYEIPVAAPFWVE